jgi:hypothetical protein
LEKSVIISGKAEEQMELYKNILNVQSQCPATDEWIKKMWYLYTMGILLSHEEE